MPNISETLMRLSKGPYNNPGQSQPAIAKTGFVNEPQKPATPVQQDSDMVSQLHYDVTNGATPQEIKLAYPELKWDDTLISDLYADIKNWNDVFKIKEAYPELSGQDQWFLSWAWEKTKSAFTGWLEKIKWAGEELANQKDFWVDSGWALNALWQLLKWWAWAVETVFSPVSGLVWQSAQEAFEATPESFQKWVKEFVAPKAKSVMEWYESQSPEQKKNLENIWIGVETIMNFVGWWAAKKTAWAAKEWLWTAASKASELLESAKGAIKPKTLESEIAWEAAKWLVWESVVDIPKPSAKSFIKKLVWTNDPEILAKRAISPKNIWSPAQRLANAKSAEWAARSLWEWVRSWKFTWDVSSLEWAAQTVVDNLKTVWAKIGDAISKTPWEVSLPLSDRSVISRVLRSPIEQESWAHPVLKRLFDLTKSKMWLKEGQQIKTIFSDEIQKLIKSWDTWSQSYKLLVRTVNKIDDQIEHAIETKLGSQFIWDKADYKMLKSLVRDIVDSAVVEWRRAPMTFTEQLWTVNALIEWIRNPASAAYNLFAKEIWDMNTRWWAWKQLMELYDRNAISALKKTKNTIWEAIKRGK